MKNAPYKKPYITGKQRELLVALLRKHAPTAAGWPELIAELNAHGLDVLPMNAYNLCNSHGILRSINLRKPAQQGRPKASAEQQAAFERRVRELVPRATSISTLYALVVEELGWDVSIQQFRRYLVRHGIQTGYAPGRRKTCSSGKQLCWACAHAVPDRERTRGCSWSRSGARVPVEGVEIDSAGFIVFCPQYEKEARR